MFIKIFLKLFRREYFFYHPMLYLDTYFQLYPENNTKTACKYFIHSIVYPFVLIQVIKVSFLYIFPYKGNLGLLWGHCFPCSSLKKWLLFSHISQWNRCPPWAPVMSPDHSAALLPKTAQLCFRCEPDCAILTEVTRPLFLSDPAPTWSRCYWFSFQNANF